MYNIKVGLKKRGLTKMSASKKPFLLRLSNEDFIKIKRIAKYNNRSMSNQIESLLIEYIRAYEKRYGEVKDIKK